VLWEGTGAMCHHIGGVGQGICRNSEAAETTDILCFLRCFTFFQKEAHLSFSLSRAPSAGPLVGAPCISHGLRWVPSPALYRWRATGSAGLDNAQVCLETIPMSLKHHPYKLIRGYPTREWKAA
jgi:hypothetical protein